MSKLKAKMVTLCVLSLCAVGYAQSGTVASGGSITNASGSISYSIGQVGDAYTSDADGTVSEGMQQPYEIYILTSEDRPNLISLIQIFPNPTIGELRVQVGANVTGHLEYVIVQQNGAILSTGQLQPGQMSISMAAYPAGTYLISFSIEGQPKSTFKVVKTQ